MEVGPNGRLSNRIITNVAYLTLHQNKIYRLLIVQEAILLGARLVKFDFSPKENEQIEAIIKIPEEKRSVIHGVVKDCNNSIIKDAVVKLFEVIGSGHNSSLKPLTHTFTDDCGQFLFGPLCANKKYALKVWYDDVKIRELIITPDDEDPCEEECSKPYEPPNHGEDCNNRDSDEIYKNKKNPYRKRAFRKDDDYESDEDDD